MKLYWKNDAPSVFHGVKSYPGAELTDGQKAALSKHLNADCITDKKPKAILETPKDKGGGVK